MPAAAVCPAVDHHQEVLLLLQGTLGVDPGCELEAHQEMSYPTNAAGLLGP